MLLYTNGVLEAAAPNGEIFGESRLIERLNRGPAQTSQGLVADILKSLQNHMKDQPQHDDMAMLAIRRLE